MTTLQQLIEADAVLVAEFKRILGPYCPTEILLGRAESSGEGK